MLQSTSSITSTREVAVPQVPAGWEATWDVVNDIEWEVVGEIVMVQVLKSLSRYCLVAFRANDESPAGFILAEESENNLYKVKMNRSLD